MSFEIFVKELSLLTMHVCAFRDAIAGKSEIEQATDSNMMPNFFASKQYQKERAMQSGARHSAPQSLNRRMYSANLDCHESMHKSFTLCSIGAEPGVGHTGRPFFLPHGNWDIARKSAWKGFG